LIKLIIQIPCFNEESTIERTLDDIPRTIAGIDDIEILIIDDGSEDSTAAIARSKGVDRVVRLPKNTGLAHAFSIGLQAAIEMDADIIVNTDGDHQYPGRYIPELVYPILRGEAEIVVGDRQIDSIKHFSRLKKSLQRFGSWIVRWASGTDVPDTTSGFRSFSREAALRLSIFSGYTYTLETIIQAGKKGIAITSIPIEINPVYRQSRLIRSTSRYILRSGVTILRIFMMYEALRVFLSLSALPLAAGLFLIGRFFYFFIIGDSAGHIQSLIVASILMILGFITVLMGLLADLIARNRRISEDIIYQIRKSQLENNR